MCYTLCLHHFNSEEMVPKMTEMTGMTDMTAPEDPEITVALPADLSLLFAFHDLLLNGHY